MHSGRPSSRRSYWLVSLLDPGERCLEFISVMASMHSRVIRVQVTPEDEARSRARVTMSIAALTDEGTHYVEGVTDCWFRHWVDGWGHAINYSLRRGRLPSFRDEAGWYFSLLGRDPDLLGEEHPPACGHDDITDLTR